MNIEYASVFESYKAHRLIEKKTGRKIKRDHKLGSLKFQIPDEYYSLIKKKTDHYVLKEGPINNNQIDFE